MNYAAHKAWLEKVVGPANGNPPDLGNDLAVFQRKTTFLDQRLGNGFAETKAQVRAGFADVRLIGDGVDREVLATIAPGTAPNIDTQQQEYDTQADRAETIKKIKKSDGEPVEINSSEGQQILAEMKAALDPIVALSQEMAREVDDHGARVFSDEDIEKELWMPLVREGVLPSNMVPDAYSQTTKVFAQGSALYQQLMEREDGQSMAPDPLGNALRFAKYAVKVGSLVGAQAIHYADIQITEASREDFAKFITAKTGTDVSETNLADIDKLREIEGLELGPLPDGMTVPDGFEMPGGELTAENMVDFEQAKLAEIFGTNSEGTPLDADALADKLAGLRKDSADLSKLEDIAFGPGGAENRDEWLRELSEKGKARPLDLVRKDFLDEADAGGNTDYAGWLEGRHAEITRQLSEGTGDQEALTNQLNAIEGAQLTQAFGEHVQHKAALNIATTVANTSIDAIERNHQRKAKRDVAERVLDGVADLVRDAITLSVSGEELAFEADARQQKHETRFAVSGAKAFVHAVNKASQACVPSSRVKDADRRQLVVDAVSEFLTSLGEGTSAMGYIHGGDMDVDQDGDSRDDMASYGMIGKSAGVAVQAVNKMVAALERRDPAAFMAELTALAAGAPSAYFAGQIGDLTRADRDLGDIHAATDNLFDRDGSEDDRAYAVSPFEEVVGAAGQTEFGFSGDMATVNDQRSVIEETEDLLKGIDEASKSAVFKKLKRAKKVLDQHPGRTKDEAAEAWLINALQTGNPAEIDAEQARQALAHIRHVIDDAAAQAHENAVAQDARIVAGLSGAVDKEKLGDDLRELDALIQGYDDGEEPDGDAVLAKFQEIQREILKDDRVVANIQSELETEEEELEALKARADLTRLEGIADPGEREAARQEALDAIETLTRELKAAEKRAKMIDQAIKGALTVLLAAVPGAGLAMKVRNLVADSYKAEKRRRELAKWMRQMEAMSGNYSVYEFAVAGEVDVLQRGYTHDVAEVVADVAGVTAETLRLIDHTHMTAAVATTVEKTIKVLNEIWYDIYQKNQIAAGWAAFKTARSDPKNRRQAREAIRLNTTFAKCVLAYGACIDKDAQAQKAVQACGLTPEVFENTTDVCNAVVEYLRVRLMDQEFETIADHGGGNWMPCPAAPSLRNWTMVKTAASKLDPPLASLATRDIDRAFDAFETAGDADRAAAGEALRVQLRDWGPKDQNNRPHLKMQVAAREFAVSVTTTLAPPQPAVAN